MDESKVSGVWYKDCYRTDINSAGEEMLGCEVCWTCICFNRNYMECWHPETDCESIVPGESTVHGSEYAEAIENPEWYRCAYWKERS